MAYPATLPELYRGTNSFFCDHSGIGVNPTVFRTVRVLRVFRIVRRFPGLARVGRTLVYVLPFFVCGPYLPFLCWCFIDAHFCVVPNVFAGSLCRACTPS
jgi:hypothetical protein